MMVTIHQSLKRRVYNPDRLLNGIITQIILKKFIRWICTCLPKFPSSTWGPRNLL